MSRDEALMREMEAEINRLREAKGNELPTLRQLYAGMAMQGMLANSHAVYTVQTAEELAVVAVAAADALIAELNKKP